MILRETRQGGLVSYVPSVRLIAVCARIRLAAALLQLLELLVKVLVEDGALEEGRVGLLELLGVEADEDGLDVVDELIDPRQV